MKIVAIALSLSAVLAASFAASRPGPVPSAGAPGGVAPAAVPMEQSTTLATTPAPTENANALAKKATSPHASKAKKAPQTKKLANNKASKKPVKSAKHAQKAAGKSHSPDKKRAGAVPR